MQFNQLLSNYLRIMLLWQYWNIYFTSMALWSITPIMKLLQTHAPINHLYCDLSQFVALEISCYGNLVFWQQTVAIMQLPIFDKACLHNDYFLWEWIGLGSSLDMPDYTQHCIRRHKSTCSVLSQPSGLDEILIAETFQTPGLADHRHNMGAWC